MPKDFITGETYKYQGIITKVIDGDTVIIQIDLGFNATIKQTLRLYGINAPEMKGLSQADGLKAKEYLESLLLDKKVMLHTLKDKKEKYGRYLAIIYVDGTSINDIMIKEGHAIPYMVK